MVLLNPVGLAALALIPVLVVLYLLRLRRKTVVVSSLLPWKAVIEQSRRRSLFHKLRNPLSLLLQIFILLLITLALARPEFSQHARENAATVILLDTSIRMQAKERSEARFDAARRGVESMVRRAHSGNQIALVAFDSIPNVLTPFTPDERALLDGLASARLTDCAPSFDDALRLARDLLASRTGKRKIIAVTDLPLPSTGTHAEADGIELSGVSLGGPLSNIAITSFSVRPLSANPTECEALVEISSFSSEPWEGTLEISLDGTLIDVRPISLEPGEIRREILTGITLDAPRLFARGWFSARIDSDDALSGDNRAFATAPAAAKRRVLLVSRGNWFLQNLLAADPRTDYEMLAPESFRPETARSFTAVIFDSDLPKARDLTSLTSGNLVFLGAVPFRPEEKPARRGAPPEPVALPDLTSVAITEVDEEHPLLRGLSLSDLRILRARTLDLARKPSAWQFDVVASADDQPLVLAGRRLESAGTEMQRSVVVAFGVSESDLPLRVAFPLLMNNILQWVGSEESAYVSSVPPGETIALSAGESLWTFPFTEPDSVPEAVTADKIERVSFRPLAKGFYRRDIRGRTSWVAVSGATRTSSDFSTASKSHGTTGDDGSPSAGPITAPRSWPQLLMIWPPWVALAFSAALLLFLEWWLFHRRKTE